MPAKLKSRSRPTARTSSSRKDSATPRRPTAGRTGRETARSYPVDGWRRIGGVRPEWHVLRRDNQRKFDRHSDTSNAALTLAFRATRSPAPQPRCFRAVLRRPPLPSLRSPTRSTSRRIASTPATAAGDQVYSVWRQNANNRYSIVCNNGQAWGGSAGIRAGDFPRVTVGQDGRVYVVYQNGDRIFLDRYSSCTAGLALQVSAAPVATLGPKNGCRGPSRARRPRCLASIAAIAGTISRVYRCRRRSRRHAYLRRLRAE